jgi:hypothetical protein
MEYTPITREEIENSVFGLDRCDDPNGAAVNIAWEYLEPAQSHINKQASTITELTGRVKELEREKRILEIEADLEYCRGQRDHTYIGCDFDKDRQAAIERIPALETELSTLQKQQSNG